MPFENFSTQIIVRSWQKITLCVYIFYFDNVYLYTHCKLHWWRILLCKYLWISIFLCTWCIWKCTFIIIIYFFYFYFLQLFLAHFAICLFYTALSIHPSLSLALFLSKSISYFMRCYSAKNSRAVAYVHSSVNNGRFPYNIVSRLTADMIHRTLTELVC